MELKKSRERVLPQRDRGCVRVWRSSLIVSVCVGRALDFFCAEDSGPADENIWEKGNDKIRFGSASKSEEEFRIFVFITEIILAWSFAFFTITIKKTI